MQFLIALAALAIQASPPPAPQWEAFHSDAEGTFEVDTGRLTREGDQVEAWVRQIYPRPAPPFGMKAFILHSRVDCRRRRATTYSMEGFTEDGTSLGLIDYPENERPNERVSRQGGDGAMLRRLCGGASE
ncbi:MAG TPA: surface-adhesin E family protein [Allosphingosinicella sp.]|nr:surface-adhesin E family protein [Allosphingosinicella sp.]